MSTDVLLITNFFHFESEKASSRYTYLARMISQYSNYSLEVVTSSFYHRTKCQRKFNSDFLNSLPYKVTLIHEPSYKKNISLNRLVSHKTFSKNVVNYLKKRKRPDIIYLVVPSLSIGTAVSKFAKKNNITLILDVQDLWPESFKMALDVPILSSVIFFPMMVQANNIYNKADYLIAVSNTFRERALGDHVKNSKSVYIGTDISKVDQIIESTKSNKDSDEFWITYVGTLGYSYNIKLVIDAISDIQHETNKKIIFQVLGSGPMMDELKNYSMNKCFSNFWGMQPYNKMIEILAQSDVAVNPIVSKSVSSIINKVGDYAAVGIPVINTQNSLEYQQLLEEYNAGINCTNEIKSVSSALLHLINNPENLLQMREGAKQMGYDFFDVTKTYKQIIDILEEARGKK